MMSVMRRGSLLLCSCLAASAALAEGFVDPTRPPAALDRSLQGSAAATPDSGPVLQSVLIAPGRSEAIISGQTVRLGEKFGDAQVVKITDTEVLLRNGSELQTLRLFPSIEKRLTYSHTSSKPGHRGEEK